MELKVDRLLSSDEDASNREGRSSECERCAIFVLETCSSGLNRGFQSGNGIVQLVFHRYGLGAEHDHARLCAVVVKDVSPSHVVGIMFLFFLIGGVNHAVIAINERQRMDEVIHLRDQQGGLIVLQHAEIIVRGIGLKLVL